MSTASMTSQQKSPMDGSEIWQLAKQLRLANEYPVVLHGLYKMGPF